MLAGSPPYYTQYIRAFIAYIATENKLLRNLNHQHTITLLVYLYILYYYTWTRVAFAFAFAFAFVVYERVRVLRNKIITSFISSNDLIVTLRSIVVTLLYIYIYIVNHFVEEKYLMIYPFTLLSQ